MVVFFIIYLSFYLSLESSLRKFTCLNLNTSILVPELGENMSLTIKNLKPSEVVHIVDADLAVEFSGENLVMPSTKTEIQERILT